MNKQQIQQAFNTFRNRMKAERGPNPDFSHFEAFKAGIEVAQLAAAAPAAAPIVEDDFYGVPDAIAAAIHYIEMDEDPDPKVLRRLRMALTAAAAPVADQKEASPN